MPMYQRLKQFASLNRLFVKIFLWFWITMSGAFIAAAISNYAGRLQVMEPPNMFATLAPLLAAEAVHSYESGGADGFARFSRSHVDDRERHLYLLDGAYHDVLSRPITDDGLNVAHAAVSGHLVVLRSRIAGYRITSA